jgi:hypothetical protein
MKTVEEITTAIRGKERMGYTTSTYTMFGDTLVRVSNHLPKSSNLLEHHEEGTKIFLIFAESDLNERTIEKHIESELEAYFDVEYMIIDDSFDFTTDMIINFIERF